MRSRRHAVLLRLAPLSAGLTVALGITAAAASPDAHARLVAERPAPSVQPAAAPAPFEWTTVEADGVTLAVRTAGTGDTVLFLAGGPGFSGTQLEPAATHLARTHRVLLPDQRGTGRSVVENLEEKLVDPQFSFQAAVADLEAIRTDLGIERWSIAGHSWGGLLAMLYAAEHPERIDRLALISPAGIDSSFWLAYQQRLAGRMDPESLQALGTLMPEDPSARSYAKVMRHANRLMAPAMVENADALPTLRDEYMSADQYNPLVGIAMQQSLREYDLRPELAEFDRPVLVLQGETDPIGRPAADRIIDALPNATLVILPGSAHWPTIEDPLRVHAALAAFLAGREPADAAEDAANTSEAQP